MSQSESSSYNLVFVKAKGFSSEECEELRDSLQDLSDETGIHFIIANGDIELMDKEELREYLGHMVSILDYELGDRKL